MTVVLVVDDDEKVAGLLTRGLARAGFETRVATDGAAAVAETRAGDVDLVLLDINLPRVDGVDAMAMMRAIHPRLPVLLVTGRDTPADVLRGFEAGADDYITKPFRFDELLARVRSRLRIAADSERPTLRHGRVTLDLHARVATRDSRTVELSAREFALAEAFFRHPGEILERDELLRRIWGPATNQESNVVDVYVGYLRRKLGDDVIVTLRGLGYRLGEPGDA